MKQTEFQKIRFQLKLSFYFGLKDLTEDTKKLTYGLPAQDPINGFTDASATQLAQTMYS